MAAELMREFEQSQQQAAPLTDSQQRRFHTEYNQLLHSNRLKERKLQELKQNLAQITVLNGGVPEDVRKSPDLKTRYQHLIQQIEDEEERIESEDRETERIEYMKQRTARATQDARIKCLAMQKKCTVLLGKYSEVQDLEAKSRYGLQHVKSQSQIYADSARKKAEKRSEKIGHLKKDKKEIQESTARLVKSLAEELVKGQTSKTVAESRAQQLAAIYSKHTHSLASNLQDQESRENLQSALRTIREVVNHSETLDLDRPYQEVRLEDLISLSHQFEMKLSSLESQVENLSMAKHDLEVNCAALRTELETLSDGKFQADEMMLKLRQQMTALGISHPASTFNQLKTFLESKDNGGSGGEDALRQDAFLSSSYMTLHVVTKRLMILLDYIYRQIGTHPTKLSELVHALLAAQKHGERLELTYGQGYTPINSERSETVEIWEQDTASASWFFREALDEIPDWGLDIEVLIKEACDILVVRLFAQDSRLRQDLKVWKSSQLDIVSHSLHSMLLERLIIQSHIYLKGRFGEVFALLRNLVTCISETSSGIENEVDRQPLDEAQLKAFLDFKTSQLTGVSKPSTVSERSISEILRKAYDKKYQKLLSQQHEFKLAEESAEYMQRLQIRSKQDLAEITDQDAPSPQGEDLYSLRLATKTASLPTLTQKSATARLLHTSSQSQQDTDAFADVRAINSRIRTIRDIERSPNNASQPLLPELRPKGKQRKK